MFRSDVAVCAGLAGMAAAAHDVVGVHIGGLCQGCICLQEAPYNRQQHTDAQPGEFRKYAGHCLMNGWSAPAPTPTTANVHTDIVGKPHNTCCR